MDSCFFIILMSSSFLSSVDHMNQFMVIVSKQVGISFVRICKHLWYIFERNDENQMIDGFDVNRGRNKMFTIPRFLQQAFEPPTLIQTHPFPIYLGSVYNALQIHDSGYPEYPIHAVVNCATEVDLPLSNKQTSLPVFKLDWVDAPKKPHERLSSSMKAETLKTVIPFITKHIDNEKKGVLIHCVWGASRSVVVSMLVTSFFSQTQSFAITTETIEAFSTRTGRHVSVSSSFMDQTTEKIEEAIH